MSMQLTRTGVEQLLSEHTPVPPEHGRCSLCSYVRSPCTIADLCTGWLTMNDWTPTDIPEVMQVVHPEFVSQNMSRAKRWHPGGINEWSLAEWLCATGGELGEAMNAAKKWKRVQDGIANLGDSDRLIADEWTARRKILEELADTFAYLVLTALWLGPIDEFNSAIVDKFNKVSERYGFPERLGHGVLPGENGD